MTLTGVVTWWQEFWTFQQMYPRKLQHKLPSKHRPSTLSMLFDPEMKTNLHQPNAKLSKKFRELVDSENLDPRRISTKKRLVPKWRLLIINQEEQQLCLHPKSSRTHQSHKRPHSRSWVFAKIHENHYPPILQTRKPDNWPTQPKRQMETCRTTDDKRVRIRRLHQQQPSRQHIVRCSPTLAEDIDYHNTWFQKSAAYSLGC